MPYSDLSDAQQVVAVAHPSAAATGTSTVGWIDMGTVNRVQFVVDVGGIGASATVDAAIRQATDTNGTGSKALSTVKSITQITASNKVGVINLSGTDLDVNNNFNCVSLLVTVGTATALLSVGCLAEPESTPPTNKSFISSVTL